MNRKQLLLIALVLFLASSVLFAFGQLISNWPRAGSVGSALFNAIGGTLFGIAVIGLVNEYFLSEDLLKKFNLLSDQRTTGIQRVLTQSETRSLIEDAFPRAKRVSAMGLGFRWLLAERKMRELLLSRITRGCDVKLFLPDPTSEEIKQRVLRDQRGAQQLGLTGFEDNIELVRNLIREVETAQNVEVRIYRNYPACSIILIDDNLLITPYLVGSLGVDNATLLFKGLTKTTEPYYRHLEMIANNMTHSISLAEYSKDHNSRNAGC